MEEEEIVLKELNLSPKILFFTRLSKMSDGFGGGERISSVPKKKRS